VFNLSGSEIVAILLLALVVLGPDKLPEALRRAGKAYAELRKIGTSFQTEMRNAMDEPMREMRDTADLLRKAARFDLDDEETSPTKGNRATPALQPQVSPTAFDDDVADVDVGDDEDEDDDDGDGLTDEELVMRTLGGGDTSRAVDRLPASRPPPPSDDGDEASKA